MSYLGETLVDVSTHPEYKHYTTNDWAMSFISRYGQIDGDHHKAWVLDQVVRCLKNTPIVVKEARWTDHEPEYSISTGKPSKEYKEWVKDMTTGVNEGYDYDTGIAP